EMMDLPGNRPEATVLEHQPFQHRDTRLQIARPELAGLFAKVDEDRAGLEDADRPAIGTVGVDDRRDLAVRAYLQESRLPLLALANVDDPHRIGQPHLLERHAYLATVRRIERVQLNGHSAIPVVDGARRRNRPAVRD